MIGGLAGTTIFSKDHTKLAPFYRDVVGLEVHGEEPGATVFGPENAALLLIGMHSDVRGRAKEPTRQIPSLLSDDVRADYSRLRAKGVEFLGEPTTEGPATVAT